MNIPWKWGNKANIIFQNVKVKFLQAVVLKHPNTNRPYLLNVDASASTYDTVAIYIQ